MYQAWWRTGYIAKSKILSHCFQTNGTKTDTLKIVVNIKSDENEKGNVLLGDYPKASNANLKESFLEEVNVDWDMKLSKSYWG